MVHKNCLMTYEGYELLVSASGRLHTIDGEEVVWFPSASEWKKYIDKKKKSCQESQDR